MPYSQKMLQFYPPKIFKKKASIIEHCDCVTCHI